MPYFVDVPRPTSRPLRKSRLNTRSPLARGLVAAWDFTERGGRPRDLVRQREITPAANAPTWQRDGWFLDGTNDGATTPISVAPPFTIACWYRPENCAPGSTHRVVTSPTTNFLMGPYNAGAGDKLTTYNGAFTQTSYAYENGRAYLHAIVDDAAFAQMYVDGVMIGGITQGFTDVISLGTDNPFAETASSTVLALFIWNRALSATEHRRLFEPLTRWSLYQRQIYPTYFDIVAPPAGRRFFLY